MKQIIILQQIIMGKMENKRILEKLLDNFEFDEAKKFNLDNLFTQLFCSVCDRDFCFGGCCSQSINVVMHPIRILTLDELIELETPFEEDDNFPIQSPFEFVSLTEYVENPMYYDCDYKMYLLKK